MWILDLPEEKEYYRLSAAQKRMYILNQLDLMSTFYNNAGINI